MGPLAVHVGSRRSARPGAGWRPALPALAALSVLLWSPPARSQQPPAEPPAPPASAPGIEYLQGLVRLRLLAAPPTVAIVGSEVRIVTASGLYAFDAETLEARGAKRFERGAGAEWARPVPLYDYTLEDLRQGKPLTVCVGATVVIGLGGNATTGFAWSVAGGDEGLAPLTFDNYVPAMAAPGAVGAGGLHVFEFLGLAEGETDLTFTYRRPWEGGETAETGTVRLTVLPARPPAPPTPPEG